MIICCGEALIDMLPRTSEAGEPCFAPYPGGALYNTAVALGRLGAPVSFLSGISTDLMGKVLIDGLEAANVAHDLSVRSDRPTTLAFVQLKDGQAHYVFYDAGSAGRMLEPADMPTIPETARAMLFGGISLVAEPCGSTYEDLMVGHSSHVATMIDPNIRPGFIRDEAAYRGRLDRMIAAADIVKLSDEDLYWLAGPGEIDDLARTVLDKGASVVCITQGAKGVSGHTERGTVFAPSQKVTVVDTVGAGDTFNAGLLAGLARADLLDKGRIAAISDDDLLAALSLGAAAAAVTVSRAGANPPWADEL